MNKEVNFRFNFQKRRCSSRRIRKVVKLSMIVFIFFSIYFLRNLPVNSYNLNENKNVTIEKESLEFEISTKEIDIAEIVASTGDVYHRLTMDDGFSLSIEGAPKIPFKTLKVLLPHGKDYNDVEIELGKEQVLEGYYKVEPAQALLPIGSDDGVEYILKQSVYKSADNYPESIYSFEGIHTLRGYRILILNIFPVRYVPNTGRLSYFENIKVKIILDNNPIKSASTRNFKEDEERVMEAVCNPEQIHTYREGYNNDNAIKTSALPSGIWDYVIITNEALKNSNGAYTFQDLANYKNSSGIQTTIVTVEEIYANYTGVDDQEKIRNFIIDAYNTWGIEYVLLGGDADGANLGEQSEAPIVPVRYLSDQTYQIPSDLYYAGLDGNWNADFDAYWGEPGEDDLFAEVYVGRAPVDNEIELSNFIRKTLAHEETDDPYLYEALMVGEELGWDYMGGDYKDEVKNGSDAYGYSTVGFPSSYNVTTLYDRDIDPDWTKDDLMPILDNGVYIVNHLGHSNVHKNMKMEWTDVYSLTNDKYFFLYSQGCYNGAFDNKDPDDVNHPIDSIAEHFIGAPNGAFALIVNSRYGWGSRYTTNGPSQHYDREFFDALFGEGIFEIGKAHQDSKEDCAGIISGSCMRCCYYELNLLGDPTTRLVSDIDHEIKVTIDAPKYPEVGNSYIINASISNLGLNNESDIDFTLYLDDVIVNSSSIPELLPGECYTLQYTWLPNTMRVYNFTAITPLIPGEFSNHNNIITELISISDYPIIINDGGPWAPPEAITWNQAVQEDWCTLIGDTYIIEDLYIDCEGQGSGISIYNSYVKFLIKNCTIKNADASTFDEAGIKLTQTNFGTISGNTLENCGVGIYLKIGYNNNILNNTANNNAFYGISLDGPNSNNNVTENTLRYNAIDGLFVYYSDHNTIRGNVIFDNENGIVVIQSEDNLFLKNEIYHNRGYGMSAGRYNDVIENIVYENLDGGIILGGHSLARGNVVTNNEHSAFDIRGFNNTLLDNSMINNGLWSFNHFGDYEQNIDTSNTVNGKPVCYYYGETGLIPDDFQNAGQILLSHCTDSLIKNVSTSPGTAGIIMGFCDNIQLFDSNASDNMQHGLFLYLSNNINITGFTISNNKDHGISLYNSSSVRIEDCVINDNQMNGIFFNEDCEKNVIKNNTIKFNKGGFYAQYDCNNITILHNTINNNSGSGVVLMYGDNYIISNNTINYNDNDGISIEGSYNSNITDNIVNYNSDNGFDFGRCNLFFILSNIVSSNQRSGIDIMDSHNNTIQNNTANYNQFGINIQWKSSNNSISNNSVMYNEQYGISMQNVNDNHIKKNFIFNNVVTGLSIDSNCYNNTIYENVFIGNGVNAEDNGVVNQWDNGVIGNFWDNYVGVDANDDGIGDLAYNISGTAGSEDRFPIFEDGSDDGDPNPGESIPGYDLAFLIGALSCITLIMVRKQGRHKTAK